MSFFCKYVSVLYCFLHAHIDTSPVHRLSTRDIKIPACCFNVVWYWVSLCPWEASCANVALALSPRLFILNKYSCIFHLDMLCAIYLILYITQIILKSGETNLESQWQTYRIERMSNDREEPEAFWSTDSLHSVHCSLHTMAASEIIPYTPIG